MKLGKNFAVRNNVDVELYQAEAAYAMVLVHRGEIDATTEKQLKQKVYKEMWSYYYADRAVAAKSTRTVWKGNLPKANEDATMVGAIDDTSDLIALIDEVAQEVREKEYLRLVMEGKNQEEIKASLNVSDRVINGMRATIVKRIQECKRSSPIGTLKRLELASTTQG